MGAIIEAIGNAKPQATRVDFSAVSEAAQNSIDRIVDRYLPGGHKKGDEYLSINPTRNDNSAGSFSVNLRNGVWCDFATGDKGGDAIDLVAYVTGKPKLDAARELADLLSVPASQGSSSTTGNIHPLPRRASPKVAPPETARTAPATFPARTQPDAEGKPRFIIAGEDGPRVRDDEKRRHVYRRGGVPVRIKVMRKGDAHPFNIYRVADGATTGWQYAKPVDFEAVPYTFRSVDPFTSHLDQPLYWPEGERDVETLTKAGLSAFTFGGVGDGLPTGCEEYVRNRAVVILADNDAAGRKHSADKAALAIDVASSVKVVHFDDVPEKGDVSDWLGSGHTVLEFQDRVKASPEMKPQPQGAADNEAATPQQIVKEAGASELPFGYRFRRDGLYWLSDDEEKPDLRLSGCFDVVAETRDGEGSSWGLLIHWIDHDGRDHRVAIPRSLLAGDGSDARRMLLDGGLFVAPSQKARGLFNSFLLQVKSPVRARATQRVGWHGAAFVLPDDSFGGASNDKLLLQTATAHEHTFRQAGTLESWQQNVARYAVGNSRLVIAISAAFAGPLIGPCAAEGGGLHFRGASSTGKSTALHVAGSVWGGGSVTGFVRSWRATANGLEGVAQGHCDTLLCLDELSQLAARDAGEAAYMLANGSGNRAAPEMDQLGAPQAGGCCFCRQGKSGSPTRLRKTVAARKRPRASMFGSSTSRLMQALGWECSRTFTASIPRKLSHVI